MLQNEQNGSLFGSLIESLFGNIIIISKIPVLANEDGEAFADQVLFKNVIDYSIIFDVITSTPISRMRSASSSVSTVHTLTILPFACIRSTNSFVRLG